jgi:outer membrane lipoprotein SlyB
MIRILLLISFALTVSGCVSSTYESESRYANMHTMTEQNVARCRVLEWRHVDIGAQPVRSQRYSRYGQVNQALPGPHAKTGATLGAVAGAALMKEAFGDSPYAMLAGAVIGSTAGANAGNKLDARSPARRGIEYSVIKADGSESVITQPLGPNDRITQAGQTCRLVNSGGVTRVLPAEHLPGAVHAPKTTRIQ